jgi:hypothetical protein
MPFVSIFKRDSEVRSCCIMNSAVTDNLQDFKTDTDFNYIRQKMLAGLPVDQCKSCYNVDSVGAVSERQSYTIEWTYSQNLKSYDDIKNNTRILNYEINVGNQCNALCRTCNVHDSNLVDREYHSLGITNNLIGLRKSTNFDIIDLESAKRIYINGGEPTINQDFHNFLQRCIDQNSTDIEIVVNTNAAVVSEKFVNLVKQFRNFKFEISIDGYGALNYYIRWPIAWDKFVNNVDTLNAVTNKKISFNTVASIYNISSLSKIFDFLEETYPTALYHIRYPVDPEQILPWNFPNQELVIADLTKIKKLNHYQKDKVFKSKIDGLINTISMCTIDRVALDQFFKFNDLLDQSRNVQLTDYIPELEQYRNG